MRLLRLRSCRSVPPYLALRLPLAVILAAWMGTTVPAAVWWTMSSKRTSRGGAGDHPGTCQNDPLMYRRLLRDGTFYESRPTSAIS